MGADLTTQAYELRTMGYTVLPGVLAAQEVAALAVRMDELQAEDEACWGVDRLDAIGQRGALRNLADRGTEFERLLGTPPLHQLADDLLGPRYVLHSYDGLVLHPGDGRFPWDFHTDLLALCGVAFPARLAPGVNCLVAVDASGSGNGATWVVPGSHRSVVRNPDPSLLAQLARQPALAAGDLLLFDARLQHCAGHNSSSRPRRLIKIELAQPWLRGQLDYARSVRPEIVDRLAPAARRAIGVPAPASIEEFWLTLERT
jgi:ectoine hydroxylase-related dioxygenase (phytanoyl-CoA dioxygenase family)